MALRFLVPHVYIFQQQEFNDASDRGNEVGQECVVDYTDQFTTYEIFKGKDALITWVREQGKLNNMVIVIKRSDLGGEGKTVSRPRLTLACERNGTYLSYKCVVAYGQRSDEIGHTKKQSRSSGTKKCGCPFLLKGVNIGDEDDWTLKVVCGVHNHPTSKYLEGHSFAGRLSKEENELLVDMSKSLVRPKDILVSIKDRDAQNVSTIRTIYNARHRSRMKEFAGRTQMQQLLHKLLEHKYVEWHRSCGDTVTDLFWAHPISIEILRAFPHVLIMDCTYKTNRYRFPLLQIVGVTSTNMTFSVAFVYIEAEKEDNYTWALTRLKTLLHGYCLPGVIATDRDLALLNSIKSVFPSAQHLLCRWHINKNVLSKCKKMFESNKQWNKFNRDWNCLVSSETEEEYQRSLQEMESKFSNYDDALEYIRNNWLIPYKDKFIGTWIDNCMHLGTTTSNRAESAHAKLKRQLRSSQLNFETSWVHIHSLLELHHTEVKASFEKSRCFVQHKFKKPELQRLVGFVSTHALNLIVCESKRLEKERVTVVSCGCTIRQTHKLPCAHEIAEYRRLGKPIPLDALHPHWRKLDFINVPNSSEQLVPPEKSRVERFNMWYEEQDEDKKRELEMKIEELMNPNTTSLNAPKEKIKTKGRPCKVDNSTRRLPSAFEIAEVELAQSGFHCQPPVTSTMASVSTVSRRKKKQKENVIAPSNKKRKENVITLPKKKQKMNLVATSPIVNVDIVLDQLSCDIQTPETNILPQRKQFKIYTPLEFIDPLPTWIYREEFPEAIRTYITGQTDVNPDGNCGYRVISMALGIDNGWRKECFVGNGRYAEIERALDYFEDGFAPEYSWLTMPDMGHIIATCYNVVLIHLSMTQCITFLPYSLQSSSQSGDTDLREVAIGYLTEDHHFIQVHLCEGHPIPPVSTMWHKKSQTSSDIRVKNLYSKYQGRVDQFKQLRGLENVATNDVVDLEDD
ncbi:uncharacterized protein [Malus domestica]|uniref:uncharacterized protein n=1 Tax=Malus domestica TaxID=3750 RepID=UPI00397595F5